MRRSLLSALAVLLLLPGLAWGAVGDIVVFEDTDFDTGDTLDLPAASGQEYIIHVIDHDGPIDVYAYNGTQEVKVRSYAGAGSEDFPRRVTETQRYRIKAGTGAVNNSYLRVIAVRIK